MNKRGKLDTPEYIYSKWPYIKEAIHVLAQYLVDKIPENKIDELLKKEYFDVLWFDWHEYNNIYISYAFNKFSVNLSLFPGPPYAHNSIYIYRLYNLNVSKDKVTSLSKDKSEFDRLFNYLATQSITDRLLFEDNILRLVTKLISVSFFSNLGRQND